MRRKGSWGSVKVLSLDRDKALALALETAQALKKELPWVREVYLFGSLARGDHTGTSDMDILVVAQGLTRENFRELYSRVYDLLASRLEISFDLILAPQEERERYLQSLGPVVPLGESQPHL